MTQQELLSLAEEVGFSHAGELNRAALEFLPQVREMCDKVLWIEHGQVQDYGETKALCDAYEGKEK